MRARIYQPAKTAMQSGTAKAKGWVLEFAPSTAREVDPLMGWTSSDDMDSQVRLRFDSRQAAEDYANAHGIAFDVVDRSLKHPRMMAEERQGLAGPENRTGDGGSVDGDGRFSCRFGSDEQVGNTVIDFQFDTVWQLRIEILSFQHWPKLRACLEGER